MFFLCLLLAVGDRDGQANATSFEPGASAPALIILRALALASAQIVRLRNTLLITD